MTGSTIKRKIINMTLQVDGKMTIRDLVGRYPQTRPVFEEHGIDPSQHRLIFAAVADRPGTANFCVYSPYVKECGPDVWQGQLLAAGDEGVEAAQHRLALLGVATEALGHDHVLDHQGVADNLLHFGPEGGRQHIVRQGGRGRQEQIGCNEKVKFKQTLMHLAAVRHRSEGVVAEQHQRADTVGVAGSIPAGPNK